MLCASFCFVQVFLCQQLLGNNIRRTFFYPKTFKKLIGTYYSCIRGSYYSGGRTNRGGRSNRGTTVLNSEKNNKIFQETCKQFLAWVEPILFMVSTTWSFIRINTVLMFFLWYICCLCFCPIMSILSKLINLDICFDAYDEDSWIIKCVHNMCMCSDSAAVSKRGKTENYSVSKPEHIFQGFCLLW